MLTLSSYISYLVDRVEYLELALHDNCIQFDTRAHHFERLGLDLELAKEVKLDGFDPIAPLKSHMLNKKRQLKRDGKGSLCLQENKSINPKYTPGSPRPHVTRARDSTDGSGVVRIPSHLI